MNTALDFLSKGHFAPLIIFRKLFPMGKKCPLELGKQTFLVTEHFDQLPLYSPSDTLYHLEVLHQVILVSTHFGNLLTLLFNNCPHKYEIWYMNTASHFSVSLLFT